MACSDTSPLPARYRGHVGHNYRFNRGESVTIISGRHKGANGIVDSAIF